ncbi:efflux RND transporter periplasmic adaptor subunit [Bythopirellula polymerisocia]|uniref:Efflux pump periplasmic linker BepF n=1 Tax=Bythopirellula polymerisocia TaxID=2528003 RepID=A0A5C6CN00_9BACT|nr:efflux RND transporter periplasmic adaptor subunit [Bythopirellula polymerisocia]TWU24721.1 Efflux pump periplasmic linker BepF [Bythopirellula polymerisocia]
MKVSPIPTILLALFTLTLPACTKTNGQPSSEQQHEEAEQEEQEEGHIILVTSPVIKDVISTQRYVCQIHSRRHIEVCALEGGYLEKIAVKEGQAVKQGELMFKILPVLHQAKLDADVAEAQLAQIELNNSQKLFAARQVSDQDVALAQAKLAKAQANVDLARAELNFTNIIAPFDGIVGQQLNQQGSLIEEGDVLTTFSDNSVMWVYFNVPEARYLDYKSSMDQNEDMNIELILANGKTFPQSGTIGAIEADFNNETGNIAFRADFPNPDGLLRHGQTGTVLINRLEKNAVVIPQRATFEILDKRYVFLVGEDGVVHQHAIKIRNEMEDIFVIQEGVKAGDKFVFEGVRQVRDGEKVEFEFRASEEVLSNLKNDAE